MLILMLVVTAIFCHSRQDSQAGQNLWEYLPKARDPEPGSDHILPERQAALRTYFFTCGVPAAGAFAHLGVREMIIFRKLR